MKRLWIAVLLIVAVFAVVGCAGNVPTGNGSEPSDAFQTGGENSGVEMGEENKEPPSEESDETPENPDTGNEPEPSEKEEITEMYLTINGNKLKVTLAQNEATAALIKRLQEGDIVYYADDYGDFEKVGSLGFSLPRNDTQITTTAGDVVLYQGNQLVLFYGNNAWSYTKIGRIEGFSVSELRTLLAAGRGRVKVTISLK